MQAANRNSSEGKLDKIVKTLQRNCNVLDIDYPATCMTNLIRQLKIADIDKHSERKFREISSIR